MVPWARTASRGAAATALLTYSSSSSPPSSSVLQRRYQERLRRKAEAAPKGRGPLEPQELSAQRQGRSRTKLRDGSAMILDRRP